jgi:hypothetical protein
MVCTVALFLISMSEIHAGFLTTSKNELSIFLCICI